MHGDGISISLSGQLTTSTPSSLLSAKLSHAFQPSRLHVKSPKPRTHALVVLVQELDPDRQADNICTVHVESSRSRHQRFSKGRYGVVATHGCPPIYGGRGASIGISAIASNYMGVFESM